MKFSALVFILLFSVSCVGTGDSKITLSVENKTPQDNSNPEGNSSNNNSENTSNNSSDNSSGNDSNNSAGSDSSDSESGSESSSDSDSNNSSSNSSTPNLIFSEDFESGSIDSNKWHLYKSHGGINSSISLNNSSKAWNASYSSSTKWHATLTTKQTFSYPITIEWDLDMATNYNNGSLSEGICIYEDDPATSFSRNTWFDITSATNLSCIRVQRRLNLNTLPVVVMSGVFFDSTDSRLQSATSGYYQAYYFASGNTLRDYRITVNINADLTFDVTIQFKDDPNEPVLFYDHVLQGSTSNFHIQFNNVDYGNYKSYYDNIKVWDGYVSPTSITP